MKRRSFLAGLAAAFAAPFVKSPVAAPVAAASEYTVTQITISAASGIPTTSEAAYAGWRTVAVWRGLANSDTPEAAA